MICGHDMGAGFVCTQGDGHLENGVPHLTMDEGAMYHTEMRKLRTENATLAIQGLRYRDALIDIHDNIERILDHD